MRKTGRTRGAQNLMRISKVQQQQHLNRSGYRRMGCCEDFIGGDFSFNSHSVCMVCVYVWQSREGASKDYLTSNFLVFSILPESVNGLWWMSCRKALSYFGVGAASKDDGNEEDPEGFLLCAYTPRRYLCFG